MSATTALGAAPPEAAGEELAVLDRRNDEQEATEETEQEEQKLAKDAKEQVVAEVASDDTTDVAEDETVIAEEVPPSGEDLRPQVQAASGEAARREAAGRVRQSAALPAGLREQFAA